MSMKKEKVGGRIKISAADVFIILFAAAAIFFLCKYVFAGADEELYNFSYVIKASEIPDEISDRIKVGDAVYFSDSGVMTGKVKAYEVTQSVRPEDGKEIPGKSDLYITVDAESNLENRIFIDGYTITVEGKYSLRTNTFSFDGVCISIGK